MAPDITRASVATHIPLLCRAFDLSSGDVLEVGTGYYSTLLLHWLATISQRHVYSYESKPGWHQRALRYANEWHHICLCADWDTADFDQRTWGLAFIDHSPGRRRPREVARLAQKAEYIVIHDTDSERDGKYEFSKVWGLFKYRYDYIRLWPHSSVVSNFHDVSGFA